MAKIFINQRQLKTIDFLKTYVLLYHVGLTLFLQKINIFAKWCEPFKNISMNFRK